MQQKLSVFLALFAVYFCGFTQETKLNYLIQEVDKSVVSMNGTLQIDASDSKYFQLDIASLETQMSGVVHREDPTTGFYAHVPLPHPDGTLHNYRASENNTLHPELRVQLTGVHTYDASGTNEPAFVKWDITPKGLHAMIMRPGKTTIFIDPAIDGNRDYYIVYERNDFSTSKLMSCDFEEQITGFQKTSQPVGQNVFSFGTCELRTYRLALAATGEYTAFHGGSVAQAQAAQATTMNRVNGVYERDMAITMVIVPNNNLIIYTNSGSDPYTNGTPGSMINENQTNCDNVIGSANYDIGHVFGTNSGGLAGLGVVCSGGQKARGVTGSAAPIGDPFDIDYVAHEMGHQFGANHTQYNTCNRNNATAMEPGSASTIMGYAGICAPNVQSNSDDHFHGISLEEIGNEILGGGHTCEALTALTNSPPAISATNGNVTVPANTPFALTATASDPDGDPLSYCWEQMDNTGNATQPPVSTNTEGPNFRSNTPSTDPTRYFPNLVDLAAGITPTWEVVPSIDRDMNFRVSVRDNSPGGGGCNDHADVTVSTDAGSGPFIVLYPSTTGITWNGNGTETVTWDVANTDAAPVACGFVDILLSTDGGLTYPTVLATNVPNDGSQIITVPNLGTTTARVMVICSNGTFFDISNNNFEIALATFDYTLNSAPSNVVVCQPNDATFTIAIGSVGGYVDPVSLSVTGVPVGATSSFTVNPVTPVGSSTLTISNTGLASSGDYTLTITAVSTSGTKTNNVLLSISGGTPSTPTLLTPSNGATGVSTPTDFTWSASAGAGVTYDIDIATDAGFSILVDQASGLSATTYNSILTQTSTSYYWRVRALTACGTSSWSSTFSFTTNSCLVIASTDVPIAISASGTPTVTSTLTVPTGGTINDLNVIDLNGTHTWINDLTFTLTSPQGTSVVLFGAICGSEDNFDVNFDDGAAPGALPCPPVGGGNYLPQGALSAFNGEDAAGVWTLTIADAFNQDGGSLAGWALEICVDPAVCNDPDVSTVTYSGGAICEGSVVTLNITGNLNDATNWAVYTGSCGGTLIGTTATSTIDVTPAAPNTVYYIRGEDGAGCVDEASLLCGTVDVIVTSAPTISLGVVTDPSTCDGSDGSIVVNGTGIGDLSWTGSANGSSNGVTLPYTISGLVGGSYTISFNDGCASNTLNSDLTEPSVPSVSLGAFTAVCMQDPSFTLSGGLPAGGTYSGNGVSGGDFDPAAAGSGNQLITYEYTDGNGCTNFAASVIQVNDCAGLATIQNNGITVYPNPTTDVLNISSGNSLIQKLRLYDSAGRLVIEKITNLNQVELALESFANGVYTIEISTSKGINFVRFVKN